MDAVSSQAKRENQLSDLDSLDTASLKALVLAKQNEIENLKLLVLKLKRMHFGPRSEKLNADIEQLELRLEDLEANQAAAEVLPSQPAAINEMAQRKPVHFGIDDLWLQSRRALLRVPDTSAFCAALSCCESQVSAHTGPLGSCPAAADDAQNCEQLRDGSFW